MEGAKRSAIVCLLLTCAAASGAGQEKQELRYTVGRAATVTVANDYGSITIHGAAGNQVLVSATPRSSAVHIQASQSGNHVELRSVHAKNGGAEAVDYDVQVPADASLLVRTSAAPVRVDGVNGGVQVESDTGTVDIRNVQGGLLRVQTIEAPATLTNVSGASIHVRTVSGEVTLDQAAGPAVEAVTNAAAIHFRGALPPNSECDLATHSGDIDVALPAGASVDVTASSVTGSVQDAMHLQPDSNPGRTLVAGKSFAGHAGSGAATLKLRSFSGMITVKKQ